MWPQLALVAVLVLLNAAFAGSELALVSLREGQLRRLEQKSSTGAVLARLAREPNQFFATIQIGITLAGFLASASAAVSLAEPLEDPLGFLGDFAGPAAIVGVTLILTFVMLVVGELAPKRVAMQRAERWGLVAARPLALMARVTRPVVWLLSHSTNVAVRLMGGDPSLDRAEVTEEELRDLVAAQKTFSAQQRHIIDGAFEIADRSLHEVLRPRPDVFVLDAASGCLEARTALVDSGHSRAPVVTTGSLDDVIGVVHLRDLLSDGEGVTAGSAATPATIFPETLGALDALRQMQLGHVQMAIVVNEHGGAEGIVTIEDLVEELVGEIYDETDRDVLTIRREPDGSMLLPGRFPAHDLPDIGVEVPDGQYATVAGFLLWQLQRIPDRPGDVVVVGPWRMEITAVDDRAITEVRVGRVTNKSSGTSADASGSNADAEVPAPEAETEETPAG
jgi:putative hemolysin